MNQRAVTKGRKHKEDIFIHLHLSEVANNIRRQRNLNIRHKHFATHPSLLCIPLTGIVIDCRY